MALARAVGGVQIQNGASLLRLLALALYLESSLANFGYLFLGRFEILGILSSRSSRSNWTPVLQLPLSQRWEFYYLFCQF